MDLRLNAARRSINLSVNLVFDLEVGRFKFLGENLLGAGGGRKMSIQPLTPSHNVYTVARVNAKPTKSLKSAILSRKSFATSKQFKWEA